MQDRELILKLKKQFGLFYPEEYFVNKIKELGTNYFILANAIEEDIKKDWDNQKIDWLITYINDNFFDGLNAEINYNQIKKLVNLIKKYGIRINNDIFLILMDSCPILENIFASILDVKDFYTEEDIKNYKGGFDIQKVLVYYCHYLHKWRGETMKRPNLDLGVKEIRLIPKEKNEALTKEEERELLLKAHNGDEEARQILIKKNMALVISIVNNYLGQKVEFNDLIQEGMIALIEAIDNFDLSYNNKLSSYAYICINKRLNTFILINYSLLHIPRNLVSKYAQFKYEITQNPGKALSCEELKNKLNINNATLNGFIKASRPFIDYDNIAAVEKNLRPYEIEISLSEELKEIVKNLPFKQRLIIENIYGLNGKTASNGYEVGKLVCSSHQYVNAERAKIVAKIAFIFYLLGYNIPSFAKFLDEIPTYEDFAKINKIVNLKGINEKNKINKYVWVAYNLNIIAARTVVYLAIYSDLEINNYLMNLLYGKVSFYDLQSKFMNKVHKRTRRKEMIS